MRAGGGTEGSQIIQNYTETKLQTTPHYPPSAECHGKVCRDLLVVAPPGRSLTALPTPPHNHCCGPLTRLPTGIPASFLS